MCKDTVIIDCMHQKKAGEILTRLTRLTRLTLRMTTQKFQISNLLIIEGYELAVNRQSAIF